MSKDNGGPAFPSCGEKLWMETPESKPEPIGFEGMSLRDYFAAKALQALIPLIGKENTKAEDCKNAYEYADKMLKAREVA